MELTVSPEFLAMTKELSAIGTRIDALRADRARYRDLSRNIAEYMRAHDIPPIEADNNTTLRRKTVKKERCVNEALLREAAKEVAPELDDARIAQLWEAIKRHRFIALAVVLDRKVHTPGMN